MDYIESQGYCEHCAKEVVTRRTLPPLTMLQRVLTVLSFGFWPIYLIRIGWKCTECGAIADNEKVHLVGRKMGGLRQIEAITSTGFCDKCGENVMIRRSLPRASSLHQRLSFITAGAWPSTWIQTGWICDKCGNYIDLEKYTDFEEIIVSRGYCQKCQTEGPIKRRVPKLTYEHKILSFMTGGSWPFYWILFGWRCYKCGNIGDDINPLIPEEYIEVYSYCKKCDKIVPATRNVPKFNFLHRILSLLSFGFWPFYWLRTRWRCAQCNSKIKLNLFKMDDKEAIIKKEKTPEPEDKEDGRR